MQVLGGSFTVLLPVLPPGPGQPLDDPENCAEDQTGGDDEPQRVVPSSGRPSCGEDRLRRGHRLGPSRSRQAQARPYPFSRRLLSTTSTLESAIAAPAIIGVSIPKAASGIARVL